MKKANKNKETPVNKNIKKNQSLTEKLSTIEEIATYGMMKQKMLNKDLEEYIAKEDAKLIKELKKKMTKEKNEEKARLLQQEREEHKELHHMKCPQCGIDLQEVKFMKTMLWACEECFGLWLNHGKLEHIIEGEAGFLYKIWNKTVLRKKTNTPFKKKNKKTQANENQESRK